MVAGVSLTRGKMIKMRSELKVTNPACQSQKMMATRSRSDPGYAKKMLLGRSRSNSFSRHDEEPRRCSNNGEERQTQDLQPNKLGERKSSSQPCHILHRSERREAPKEGLVQKADQGLSGARPGQKEAWDETKNQRSDDNFARTPSKHMEATKEERQEPSDTRIIAHPQEQRELELILEKLKNDIAESEKRKAACVRNQSSEGLQRESDPALESSSFHEAQEWMKKKLLCMEPPGDLEKDWEAGIRLFDNWCQPLTQSLSFSDFREQKNSSYDIEMDSSGSISTFGHMFGDLKSLPDNNTEDHFTVGDFSAFSDKEIGISSSGDHQEVLKKVKLIESTDDLSDSLDEISSINDVEENGVDVMAMAELAKKEKRASTTSRLHALSKELDASIERFGRHDIRSANIAAAIGDLYVEEGEYERALRHYLEASIVYSVKLGDHHITSLDCRIRIGEYLGETGKHKEAIEMLYSVMILRQSLLGENHSSVADVLTRISSVLDKKGESQKAIKELKRALKMYRETLGDSHPRIASTVDTIASLYMKSDDYQKAVAILEEVVKLRAATLGVSNPDVGTTLMELSKAHIGTGDYAKALKSVKKAHAIFVQAENDRSSDSLLALENIADIYKKVNDKEKAVAAFVRVLRIKKETNGDHHPLVAEAYLALGKLLKEVDERERAMKCTNHALTILVNEGNDMNHVKLIATTLHEIAQLHTSSGNFAEGAKIFKQELMIRQKIGEGQLPKIAKTLNELGLAEYELKNYGGALDCFMEALSILEKTEAIGAGFGEALLNTGLVLRASGQQARAYEAFLEAKRILKSQGVKDSHPLLQKAIMEERATLLRP